MVDAQAIKQLFSTENTTLGIFFVVCLFVWRMWHSGPAVGETWILWQQTKAAQKVSDWSRLRDEIRRLSEAEVRCRKDYDDLHRKHMELHQEYADLGRRVAELEGYNVGQGRASQEAAGIVAIERMKGKDKP